MMHCKCPLPEGSVRYFGKIRLSRKKQEFWIKYEGEVLLYPFSHTFQGCSTCSETRDGCTVDFSQAQLTLLQPKIVMLFSKKIVMLLLRCFSKTDFYTSFCFKFICFILYIYTTLLSICKYKFCFSNNGNYICHYIHLYIWDKMKSFSNDVESSICERLLKPEECICSEMRSPVAGGGLYCSYFENGIFKCCEK